MRRPRIPRAALVLVLTASCAEQPTKEVTRSRAAHATNPAAALDSDDLTSAEREVASGLAARAKEDESDARAHFLRARLFYEKISGESGVPINLEKPTFEAWSRHEGLAYWHIEGSDEQRYTVAARVTDTAIEPLWLLPCVNGGCVRESDDPDVFGWVAPYDEVGDSLVASSLARVFGSRGKAGWVLSSTEILMRDRPGSGALFVAATPDGLEFYGEDGFSQARTELGWHPDDLRHLKHGCVLAEHRYGTRALAVVDEVSHAVLLSQQTSTGPELTLDGARLVFVAREGEAQDGPFAVMIWDLLRRRLVTKRFADELGRDLWVVLVDNDRYAEVWTEESVDDDRSSRSRVVAKVEVSKDASRVAVGDSQPDTSSANRAGVALDGAFQGRRYCRFGRFLTPADVCEVKR
ncbi:MAG: hypothetical protein U0271_23925 [Polyangiaceae bacterium]